MINFNSPINLIFSDEFVKQPVNEISESLKKNTANKIIIYGQGGCGKTTVLYNHQYRSIGTDNPVIYTRFDSVGMFGDNRAERESAYDDKFVNCYYELIMANKILNFIENNYEKVFAKYFRGNKEELKKLLGETYNYIRESSYRSVAFDMRLSVGELSASYIEKLKKVIGINTLSLIIDRFDWTDGHSETAQVALREYFKIFDKSIITTDDESIVNDESSRIELINKGFDLIEINYGKDLEIMKRLLALRINKYNSTVKEKEQRFPFELLSDEVIERLLEKANGNISVVLSSINEMGYLLGYDSDYVTDPMTSMERASNRAIAQVKRLKERSRPIKLYLSK